jgi:hypothetical protein
VEENSESVEQERQQVTHRASNTPITSFGVLIRSSIMSTHRSCTICSPVDPPLSTISHACATAGHRSGFCETAMTLNTMQDLSRLSSLFAGTEVSFVGPAPRPNVPSLHQRYNVFVRLWLGSRTRVAKNECALFISPYPPPSLPACLPPFPFLHHHRTFTTYPTPTSNTYPVHTHSSPTPQY